MTPGVAAELATVSTRLAALPEMTRKRLVNWGYAQADAAVRSYVESTLFPPESYPYPEAALGG